MSSPSIFFNFLLNPTYSEVERKETNIFTTSVKIYLLYILFSGLAYGLIKVFLNACFTLPIDETLEIPARLKDHLWKYFLIVALVGPVGEEIIFRLSLVFKPAYISLSLATLGGLLSHKIIGGLNAFLIFIVLFFLIYKIALAYSAIFVSFWQNHFRFILYVFPVLFGLGHIFNYRFTNVSQYWIAPLIVFPELVLGFVLSFTRLYYKKGFVIAILIHVIMNSIAVSITLAQHNG